MHPLQKSLCASVALALASLAVHAQDKPANYPLRPIRLICPVAPGAGNDTVTRAAGQMISEKLGQTVVVDNRSGGGTVIATELGAQAPPDGYTLLSATDTIMLLGAMKRVPFDIRKAFEPVVIMTSQPYILVVNPSLQRHYHLAQHPGKAGDAAVQVVRHAVVQHARSLIDSGIWQARWLHEARP